MAINNIRFINTSYVESTPTIEFNKGFYTGITFTIEDNATVTKIETKVDRPEEKPLNQSGPVYKKGNSWVSPSLYVTFNKYGLYSFRYLIYYKEDGSDTEKIKEFVFNHTLYRESKATVNIEPINATIKPGEKAFVTYFIQDMPLPYTTTQVWKLDGKVLSDKPYVNVEFDKPGIQELTVEVIIDKDQYDKVPVIGKTFVNFVLDDTTEDIAVNITSTTPEIEVFESSNFTADITGIKDDDYYTCIWTVSGVVQEENSTSFSYTSHEVGIVKVQCHITVHRADQTGTTIRSPAIPLTMVKNTSWTPYLAPNNYYSNAKSTWGWDGIERIAVTSRYQHPSYPERNDVILEKPGTYKIFIDNVKIADDEIQYDGTHHSHWWKDKIPDFMGEHTARIEYYASEHPLFEARKITYEYKFNVGKCKIFSRDGTYFQDKDFKQLPQTIYIKGEPGGTIEFSVINVIDVSAYAKATEEQRIYNAYHRELGKEGKYELLNKWGEVEATAVNNVFTYHIPADAEKRTLTGSVRHTLDRPDIFAVPTVAIKPVTLEIGSFILDPLPEIKIIPKNPIANRREYNQYNLETKNIPSNSTVTYKWYYDNELQAGRTGTECHIYPTKNLKKIKCEVLIKTPNYNDMHLVDELVVEVSLLDWPELSLELVPNKTALKWGETLTSSFSISGLNKLMEPDPDIVYPVWFKDDISIKSLANDGSLSWITNKPGVHKITAKVDVIHPEYKDQKTTLTKSFNITTEKREMAITLKITPVDPEVGIGKSQRFNAEITDAPVDSTTVYKWTVDDVVQTSVTNSLDVTPTTEGDKIVKVEATTSADSADDVVTTAQTTLKVSKNTMTATAYIDSDVPAVVVGGKVKFTVKTNDVPVGASTAYLWDSGETTESITVTTDKVGTLTTKCTVTITHDDYNTKTLTPSATTNVTGKVIDDVVMVVIATPDTVKVGEEYEVEAIVTGGPTGKTVKYEWNTGQKTAKFKVTPTDEGKVKYECTLTVSAENYLDFTTKDSHTVTVKKASPEYEEGCTKYIHPLDHRESAYLWQGWWVMQEIENAVAKGIDWKNPDETELKYKCDLKTIAFMMDKYPEIEIQESKHGYILNKSRIESGFIY